MLYQIECNQQNVFYSLVTPLTYKGAENVDLWLQEAIDELGGKDIVLCGCSYGAYLVLKYLERKPNALVDVVLICPFGITHELGPIGSQLAFIFKCCFSIGSRTTFGAKEIAKHIIYRPCCGSYWDEEPIRNVIEQRKILLIYGQNDRYVPPTSGVRLLTEYPDMCEVCIVNGMAHLDYGITLEMAKDVAYRISLFVR